MLFYMKKRTSLFAHWVRYSKNSHSECIRWTKFCIAHDKEKTCEDHRYVNHDMLRYHILKCMISKVEPLLRTRLPHHDSSKMLEHRPSFRPPASTLSPLGLASTIGFCRILHEKKSESHLLGRVKTMFAQKVPQVCSNTVSPCVHWVVHFQPWGRPLLAFCAFCMHSFDIFLLSWIIRLMLHYV